MKTWKQCIIGIIAIIALTFIACDNGNGKTDPVCTCNPKEHYLPCACGGTDCTCAVIPRGELTEYQDTSKIPIYQKAGVTDEQAIDVTNALTTVWNDRNIVGDGDKIILKGKIQEIWIIETATDQSWKRDIEVVNNKAIIKVQPNCQYIGDIFPDLSNNLSDYGL
jgi:hypothetical protein